MKVPEDVNVDVDFGVGFGDEDFGCLARYAARSSKVGISSIG